MRISRSSPRVADEVIRKLVETKKPESILIAGRSIYEANEVDKDLKEIIVNALKKLSSDITNSETLRESAKMILEKLEEFS